MMLGKLSTAVKYTLDDCDSVLDGLALRMGAIMCIERQGDYRQFVFSRYFSLVA